MMRTVSSDKPGSAAAASEEAELRVLVVSDVRLLQDGVARSLGQHRRMSVVGTVDAAGAEAEARALRPDVILFDATRPSRIEQAKQLVAELPDSKIVAFGVSETEDEILALAAAGVAGYVREDALAEEAVQVVDSVMRHELVCSPRAAASLYHRVAVLSQNGTGPIADPTLSRRELEIAQLIERGLSNKEIARRLGIEATTVKNHVHNILDKLKVHRRGEAAARIRASLLVRPPAAPEAKR
jgi:DNA-binding NarL/FixJ family response regulator